MSAQEQNFTETKIQEIEYCKLIEDWSTYVEEHTGCMCDKFEARKCQGTDDSACCDCKCHIIHDNKKVVINIECPSCLIFLEQANIFIKSGP